MAWKRTFTFKSCWSLFGWRVKLCGRGVNRAIKFFTKFLVVAWFLPRAEHCILLNTCFLEIQTGKYLNENKIKWGVWSAKKDNVITRDNRNTLKKQINNENLEYKPRTCWLILRRSTYLYQSPLHGERGFAIHLLDFSFLQMISEARPNDRNTLTQHIATSNWVQHAAYVWPPCCDVLQQVGCCWLKFETGQIFLSKICGCCSCLARFVQQCCPQACELALFSTRNMSQYVTTGWPNAYDMLRPTMFRSVAFKCCDRLPELANTGPTLGYVALRCCYRLAGAWLTSSALAFCRLELSF